MAELTPEQLEKAESMSIEELRELAMKEEGPVVEEKPKAKVAAQDDELDNSEETGEGEEETVFRKEIKNDDGSVDVYEADSIEELVDKIAEGKRQAVAQMKRVQEEKKALQKETAQQTEDENYIIAQRFQKEPMKVIDELVAKRLQKEADAKERSLNAQNRFIATHPDYVVGEYNGNKMMEEFRRMYPASSEFDYEGLEKAYQSLKAGGLLQLKAEGGEETTAAETKGEARTEKPAAETTQSRSPRRSSIVQMRAKPAPVTKGFDEDEAYKMPMDELLKRANAQLAGQTE